MVKTIWFLKRRSDMSTADFHRYWRETHGPLFCSSPAVRRYVLRYEQNHATPENAAMSDEEFDGASVMWFRSVDDHEALFADPDFQNVLADGENFLDLTGTKQLVSFAEVTFEIATGAS
jgi:uncharacterized protein (TIGR02118 family)